MGTTWVNIKLYYYLISLNNKTKTKIIKMYFKVYNICTSKMHYMNNAKSLRGET